MCLDPEQFHNFDRRQQRKLLTRILSIAQQSDEFWQGTSIDAEPYAEAYQAVMISLPHQLSQFNSSKLTFVQWLNRWLVVETLARSSKIWQAGEFTHPEIYKDAKQITLEELLEKFKHYDSTRGSVINWFNFLLKRRFIDLLRQQGRELKNVEEIGRRMGDREPDWPNPPEIPPDFPLTRKLINKIRQWAEEKHSDLRQCCLRDRSEVNCYTLILMRLPRLIECQGKFEFSDVPKWKTIATELNVPESTVRCHFKNQCIDHLKQAFPAGSYA